MRQVLPISFVWLLLAGCQEPAGQQVLSVQQQASVASGRSALSVEGYDGDVQPFTVPVLLRINEVRSFKVRYKINKRTTDGKRTFEAAEMSGSIVAPADERRIWDLRLDKLQTGKRTMKARQPLAIFRILSDSLGNNQDIDVSFPGMKALGATLPDPADPKYEALLEASCLGVWNFVAHKILLNFKRYAALTIRAVTRPTRVDSTLQVSTAKLRVESLS